MAITFAVDEVEAAAERAPTVGIRELVGEHLYLGVEGEPRMLAGTKGAPLLAAVHHAFAEHRSLVLSPDAVWLTIAQGVAQHVRLNGEALRPRFVRHDGKQLIELEVQEEPGGAAWASLVEGFRAAIGERVGQGLGRLMTCDFSTSGPVERTASEIVLMDTMSPYFDYGVMCVCGIPTITLLGTPDDWRAIRTRIDVIAELDLAWWTASLAPIADRLLDAAEGRPDLAFFRNIYKPQEAYGWDRIAGWAARLYPYVEGEGSHDRRNPLLALALDAPLPEAERGWYSGPGVALHEVPSRMAQALVRLRFSSGAPERRIALDGGLIGVEQDASGALVPRAGYVVRDDGGSVMVLVNRIRSGHHTTVGSDQEQWRDDAKLRAFFVEIGEATLFEGDRTWRVLPPDQRQRLLLEKPVFDQGLQREVHLVRVVDLPDGTTLAIVHLVREPSVVRLRVAALESFELPETIVDEVTARTIRVVESPFHMDMPRWTTSEAITAIPVLRGSLFDILERALATGGDLDLPTDGCVFDHAPHLWDTASHAAALMERLRRDHPIVLGKHGRFGTLVGGEILVGAERWRVLGRGQAQSIELARGSSELWMRLPDGSELLVVHGNGGVRCVVRHPPEGIEVRELRPAKGKRPAQVQRVSTLPLTALPVVGRSMVEVLEHALAHGALPEPTCTYAAWIARIRELP